VVRVSTDDGITGYGFAGIDSNALENTIKPCYWVYRDGTKSDWAYFMARASLWTSEPFCFPLAYLPHRVIAMPYSPATE
jgi:hypothetical protein